MSRKKVFREILPPEKCGGKSVYRSEKEAREIAAQQMLIFANSDLELDVYKCGFCGGWHLTSRKKVE
jgi:hypothetical protein